MKKDMLKVGTSKGEFSVEVEIDVPETLADCAVLSKANDLAMFFSEAAEPVSKEDGPGVAYMVAKFTRGYRIDLQEGGARQAVAELLGGKNVSLALKDAEFMAKVKQAASDEIAGFDPAAPRARGGRKPAVPQVIRLVEGKTSYTAEEVAAMLSGVKGLTVLEA